MPAVRWEKGIFLINEFMAHLLLQNCPVASILSLEMRLKDNATS